MVSRAEMGKVYLARPGLGGGGGGLAQMAGVGAVA